MLWFLVRVNDQGIGSFAARRRQELDLRSPSVVDAVCDYEITIDGTLVGTIKHRYGDGSWALIRAGLELWESKQ